MIFLGQKETQYDRAVVLGLRQSGVDEVFRRAAALTSNLKLLAGHTVFETTDSMSLREMEVIGSLVRLPINLA